LLYGEKQLKPEVTSLGTVNLFYFLIIKYEIFAMKSGESMKKIILLLCGSICLSLAAIGLFIPILPTTPFVLLAAGCFSGYPAVYARISKIHFFRVYLECYKNGTPIPPKMRIGSIAVLWALLIGSMCMAKIPMMFAVLPIVGAAVTVHLLTIGRKRTP
jgi:uncharacterized membrane protein YbaN (DUF454 family)